MDNKETELLSYLSQIVTQMALADNTQVYVTSGEQVLSNPRKEETATLNPCGHVEADPRMLLHVHMLRVMDTVQLSGQWTRRCHSFYF